MLKYLFGSLALISLNLGPVGGKYQLPENGQLEDSFTLFTAYSASFNCCSERTFDNPHITATSADAVSAIVGAVSDVSTAPFAVAATEDCNVTKDDSQDEFADTASISGTITAVINVLFPCCGAAAEEHVISVSACDAATGGFFTVKMKSTMTVKIGSTGFFRYGEIVPRLK